MKENREILESDSKPTSGSYSETIVNGLKPYAIGLKIRRLRLRKSMGLVELGRHTSLSPAMLSKLENGHVIPTLPTLLRIAMVFSVGLEHFFSDDTVRRIAIIRSGERQSFHDEIDGKPAAYRFQCLDYKAVERKSSSYLAEFYAMPPEEVPVHEHVGSEFIYVFEGCLGLTFEGQEHRLETGDAVYIDPSYPHGYRRVGQANCHALIVTVP